MKTVEELEKLQEQYMKQYRFHKEQADIFHKEATKCGAQIIDRLIYPELFKS